MSYFSIPVFQWCSNCKFLFNYLIVSSANTLYFYIPVFKYIIQNTAAHKKEKSSCYLDTAVLTQSYGGTTPHSGAKLCIDLFKNCMWSRN